MKKPGSDDPRPPLKPVRFEYVDDNGDPHLELTSEELPDLVAIRDSNGRAVDIISVLSQIVREQGKRIASLEARLEALQSE